MFVVYVLLFLPIVCCSILIAKLVQVSNLIEKVRETIASRSEPKLPLVRIKVTQELLIAPFAPQRSY
jgi:hypothetical protein